MTGLGSGEAPAREGVVRVELRAVNHRHLDVRVRAPIELSDASAAVEEVVRARAGRGRIEAHLRYEAPSSSVAIDMERAKAVYRGLCDLRDELAPGQPVAIESVLRVPQVFGPTTSLATEDFVEAVRVATEHAAADLARMRAREGDALERDLRQRVALLREHASQVAAHRPRIVQSFRERLHKRIETLLEGATAPLDTGRLEHEVATFADRSDIAEELTRLASHLDQFLTLLGEENVGRKLDFLIQELGREVNTVGSKANDALVAHRVVEMKAELERIREQVQNVL